jgi:hypothetical protein
LTELARSGNIVPIAVSRMINGKTVTPEP